VTGYFTVYERGYEMWDEFGPYVEIISRGAGTDLDADPDVNFLVNHAGLSMARTINETLELGQDDTGGWNKAWLNPERGDVRDLVSAINDGTVTEQSFAFLIDKGRWNDDFTVYRIDSYLIHRGDTSAVNYGANPYTSIATRSMELLHRAGEIPAGIAAELYRRLAPGGAGDEPVTWRAGDFVFREEPLDDKTASTPAAPSTVDDARMAEVDAWLARNGAL